MNPAAKVGAKADRAAVRVLVTRIGRARLRNTPSALPSAACATIGVRSATKIVRRATPTRAVRSAAG
jgi:hypothetical protein